MRSLKLSGQPSQLFDNLGGFVLNLTDQQARRLRALGGVKSVEADAAVFLEPTIPGASANTQQQAAETSALATFKDSTFSGTAEIQPWGVGAVWQNEDIRDRGNFGETSYAFVIDSGLRSDTGDLNLAPLD